MNAKKSKSLRRMAREIAREANNTAVRYRTILHNPRQVMVGWKPAEPDQKPTVAEKAKGILSSMWGWLKKMAGREEPAQKPAPESFVPDIQTVAPETHVLAGGIRFYLRRMKAACFYTRNMLSVADLRRPDREVMRTLVRRERDQHLQALAAR